jgi:hypothetical protein
MTSGPDIIMGVARAADTAKHREAASRLERLNGQASSVANAGTPLAGTPLAGAPTAEAPLAWPAEVRVADANASWPSTFASPSRTTDRYDAPPDAYVQFEALLLQNMVEAMMPKDSEAMFGSGTAGMIWKSMLAEKVAAEIARTGTLGIAKQIAAGEAAKSAAAAPSKVNDA